MTPATRDRELATDWFNRFEGAGLDGVVAKDENLVYSPGKRTMIKIKHERTIDCAVAGFRWYKDKKNEAVGSLLLGLFDDGRAPAARRRDVVVHARAAQGALEGARAAAREREERITRGRAGPRSSAKPAIESRA